MNNSNKEYSLNNIEWTTNKYNLIKWYHFIFIYISFVFMIIIGKSYKPWSLISLLLLIVIQYVFLILLTIKTKKIAKLKPNKILLLIDRIEFYKDDKLKDTLVPNSIIKVSTFYNHTSFIGKLGYQVKSVKKKIIIRLRNKIYYDFTMDNENFINDIKDFLTFNKIEIDFNKIDKK